MVSLHHVKSQEIQKNLHWHSALSSCYSPIVPSSPVCLQCTLRWRHHFSPLSSAGGWIHTIKGILNAVWLFNTLHPGQGCSPFVSGLCLVGILGAPHGFLVDGAWGCLQHSPDVGAAALNSSAGPALGLGMGSGALCAGTGVPRPLPLPPRR